MNGWIQRAQSLRMASFFSVFLVIVFFTGLSSARASDALYVDPNGNVGVGTNNPVAKLQVSGFGSGETGLHIVSQQGAYVNLPNSSGDLSFMAETNSGGGAIYFRTRVGAAFVDLVRFYATEPKLRVFGNASATTFITSSSRRWKQDITPITGAMAMLIQLRPVSYRWNEKAEEAFGVRSDGDSRQIGFIAEEVAEVMPHIVSRNESGDEVDGVAYSQLIPVLVQAMKEQQAQIEAQQRTIESLQAAVETLKDRRN